MKMPQKLSMKIYFNKVNITAFYGFEAVNNLTTKQYLPLYIVLKHIVVQMMFNVMEQ
jgi:hypothetical protein